MAAAWAVGRMFQAAGYGAMIDVLCKWYAPSMHGRVLGLASLSYNLGDGFIRLVLGALMSAMTGGVEVTSAVDAKTLWIDTFYCAIFFSVALGMPALTTVHDRPSTISVGGDIPLKLENTALIRKRSIVNFKPEVTLAHTMAKLRMMASRQQFWLLLVMCVCLTLLRETFVSWTSVYFADRFHLHESNAAVLSLIFPLFGTLSALVGGVIIDRGGSRLQKSQILLQMNMLLSSALGLAAYMSVDGEVALMSVLVCIVALFLIAPFSLVTGVFAMQLADDVSQDDYPQSSATHGNTGHGLAVGLVNAVGNFGAILAGHSIGSVADAYGWTTVWWLCYLISFVGCCASLLYNRCDRLQDTSVALALSPIKPNISMSSIAAKTV